VSVNEAEAVEAEFTINTHVLNVEDTGQAARKPGASARNRDSSDKLAPLF
jgi:hypothetical protein